MALTQMQLIQSLGEALSWFERERNWGIPPTELRHLCGRIGELYAAMITNGQMATEVNQHGYDVVSRSGERISVKTTAMMGNSGHVTFNANSLKLVDRVIVLRINTDEMQVETLYDASIGEALRKMTATSGGKRTIPLSRLLDKPERPRAALTVVKQVTYRECVVRELENGAIEVEKDGKLLQPVKPVLRELATPLNLSLLSASGAALTTRQLGSQIIKGVQALTSKAP